MKRVLEVIYRFSLAVIVVLMGLSVGLSQTQLVQAEYSLGTEVKLLADDGAVGDEFGHSVAIDNDTAVVGALGKNNQTGVAYVFTRTGGVWSQQAKLTASDNATNDGFGVSVAIKGETIVVGSFKHNTYAGAAYVFTRSGTTWSEQQKLTASDGYYGDYFGWAVDIYGDTVVVGAPYKSDLVIGGSCGAAYVYTRSGNVWTQQGGPLMASDAAAGDKLGFDVAIFLDTVIAGAPYKGNGAAYVFTRIGTTWSQSPKLTAADGEAGDNFGWAVDVNNTTALVTASGKASSTGAAYVFIYSGIAWSQQTKLTASDGAAHDVFGNWVAIEGDTAVVGACGEPYNTTVKGAAYVFTRVVTTWTQETKLIASDGVGGDQFGHEVSISGNTTVVGAYVKDSSTGAIYVYRDIPAPEISIEGNAIEIVNGDSTPSSNDDTDFGTTAVNLGTVDKTYTIKNTGDAQLILSGTPIVVLSGANPTDFSVIAQPGSPVAVGGQTTFTVRFDPLTAGLRSAIVSITNDDFNENPYTFSIQGTGAPIPVPDMRIEGNSIEIINGDSTPSLSDHTYFVTTGAPVDRTYTIKNTGNASLTLSNIPIVVLVGANAADFAVTAQPASPVVAGGQTTFTVRFTPSATGLRSAEVRIPNDDADKNPYTFAIKGTDQEIVATNISISVPPGAGASVDANLAVQPVILVVDQYGNPVNGVVVTASRGSGTGDLRGIITATSDTSGLSTFTDLGYNKSGETFSIHFAAGGLFVDSASLGPILAGAATQVRVETAANGSGTVVEAQNLNAGNPLGVYGVTRDQYANYIGNPADTAWSLVNITGGVADGDLSAGVGASVTLTGHLVGSAMIHAANGSLTPNNSGTITVIPGPPSVISLSTPPAAGASVDDILATQPVIQVTDQFSNPISGIAVTASRATGTGILRGTLTATTDTSGLAAFTDLGYNKSGEAFTLRFAAGSLSANSASLGPLATGAPTQVRVETAANGSGSIVTTRRLTIGTTLNVYAITRDQYSNFIGNPGDAAWSLTNKTGDVADSDISPATGASAVMTGNKVGTCTIHTAITGLTSVDSGMITVAVRSSGGGGGGGGERYTTITLNGLVSAASLRLNSQGIIQSAAQVKSSDSKVILNIANGTRLLTSSNSPLPMIKAVVLDTPPAPLAGNTIIMAYTLEPTGAKFVPGLTLSIAYDPAALPKGVLEKDLYIAYYDGTQWQVMTGNVDTQAHVVKATISHFSSYALMGKQSEIPAPTPTASPSPTATITPIPTTPAASPTTPKPTASPVVSPSPVVTSVPTSSATLTPTTPTTQPKQNNYWGLIIGIIVVILVIVLLLYFLWQRRRKDKGGTYP